MGDFIRGMAGSVIDIVVYAAMALVFIVGVAKCVLPVRRSAGALRRASRRLLRPVQEGERPAWQDSLFLGKALSGCWARFLKNAEHLNSRGLSCNVEDYVNDDTALDGVCHPQLAEVIPGLLTSLGILGTFIGLMRGLGGLDVSDAAKTMESIPAMIGGMTFAFSTSIVGVACSISFNVLYRISCGSAEGAIDEFQTSFDDMVMIRPLDDTVTLICQQEDQENMIRQAAADLTNRISEGVTRAVENSFVPVTYAMNQFIMGQTQTQLEGLENITRSFISQMDRSLSGQLTALGSTLAQVNHNQAMSYDSLDKAMASCETIMSQMASIQSVSEQMMKQFDHYVATIDTAQANNDAFLDHGSQVLTGMMQATEDQSAVLGRLRTQLDGLQREMSDFADWSNHAVGTMTQQADAITQLSGNVTGQLENSAQDFVSRIGAGLNRSVGLFDDNINGILKVLDERLTLLRAENGLTGSGDELTQIQKTLMGIQESLDKLNKVLAAAAKEDA